MEKLPDTEITDVTSDIEPITLPHPPERTAFKQGKKGYHHTITRADLHLGDKLGGFSGIPKNNPKNPD